MPSSRLVFVFNKSSDTFKPIILLEPGLFNNEQRLSRPQLHIILHNLNHQPDRKGSLSFYQALCIFICRSQIKYLEIIIKLESEKQTKAFLLLGRLDLFRLGLLKPNPSFPPSYSSYSAFLSDKRLPFKQNCLNRPNCKKSQAYQRLCCFPSLALS